MGDASKMPCLKDIHPHISLVSKMYGLLTNQGSLEAHTTDALKK